MKFSYLAYGFLSLSILGQTCDVNAGDREDALALVSDIYKINTTRVFCRESDWKQSTTEQMNYHEEFSADLTESLNKFCTTPNALFSFDYRWGDTLYAARKYDNYKENGGGKVLKVIPKTISNNKAVIRVNFDSPNGTYQDYQPRTTWFLIKENDKWKVDDISMWAAPISCGEENGNGAIPCVESVKAELKKELASIEREKRRQEELKAKGRIP